MKRVIHCKHGHTREEHPNCFLSGDIISIKPDWFEHLKIGYLDIEADGLKPDWGTMLTWSIKPEGELFVMSDVITREDLFYGNRDKRIIQSMVRELSKYDVVVTYYGTGYDLPFVRAKALHYNLDFVDYGKIFHWDLYYTVKSKLHLSSNSLENVCDYLGIEGKTPLSKDVWRDAKYGDPTAIGKVLEHNKGDVIILENLANKLLPFVKLTKRSV